MRHAMWGKVLVPTQRWRAIKHPIHDYTRRSQPRHGLCLFLYSSLEAAPFPCYKRFWVNLHIRRTLNHVKSFNSSLLCLYPLTLRTPTITLTSISFSFFFSFRYFWLSHFLILFFTFNLFVPAFLVVLKRYQNNLEGENYTRRLYKTSRDAHSMYFDKNKNQKY